MKKILRKLLFISLPSIFAMLVILEIGMRITGYLYNQYHNPDAHARIEDFNKGKFNILCLGDSFTFGAGALPDNSYPRQLERLLRRNTGKDIRVINAGRLGDTSSLLLKNFRKDLARYNPDIAIVMIGINNFWNLEDSSYFILKNKAGYLEKIDSALSHLRVYKLIKIGYLNFENNKKESLKRIRIEINKKSLRFSTLGEKLFLKGKYNLAKRALERAQALDKNNYQAYFWLVHTYNFLLEFEKAKKESYKAIEAIDEWNDSFVSDLIMTVRMTKKELKKIKRYIEAKYSRNSEKRKNFVKLIDARLDFLEDKQMPKKVLEYDLNEIIRIAKSKGVTLILQTYPHDNYLLYDVFLKISNKFNIQLVDNIMVFKEILKHSSVEDFFVPDGHCNDKGYRIISEDVYNTLVEHKLLP